MKDVIFIVCQEIICRFQYKNNGFWKYYICHWSPSGSIWPYHQFVLTIIQRQLGDSFMSMINYFPVVNIHIRATRQNIYGVKRI